MKRILLSIILVLVTSTFALADTITITIPSNDMDDVVNALASEGNYVENVPDGAGGTIPNPQTKEEFAKEMIHAFIVGSVTKAQEKADRMAAREARKAAKEARKQALSAIVVE